MLKSRVRENLCYYHYHLYASMCVCVCVCVCVYVSVGGWVLSWSIKSRIIV